MIYESYVNHVKHIMYSIADRPSKKEGHYWTFYSHSFEEKGHKLLFVSSQKKRGGDSDPPPGSTTTEIVGYCLRYELALLTPP